MKKSSSKTLLVSHQKKFIFIHNYKVAGTSIRAWLGGFQSMPSWFVSNIQYYLKCDYLGYMFSPIAKHSSYLEIERMLPSHICGSYFKFGFVRNPWDWEVSLYHFMLQNTAHHQHQLVKGFDAFDKYLEWRKENFKTQSSFFMDNSEKIAVDFIGRIESFDQDCLYIANRLNVPHKIFHNNRSNHSKYRNYYNGETKKILKDIYREDIERFNYSF